jgi:hypothetical protein
MTKEYYYSVRQKAVIEIHLRKNINHVIIPLCKLRNIIYPENNIWHNTNKFLENPKERLCILSENEFFELLKYYNIDNFNLKSIRFTLKNEKSYCFSYSKKAVYERYFVDNNAIEHLKKDLNLKGFKFFVSLLLGLCKTMLGYNKKVENWDDRTVFFKDNHKPKLTLWLYKFFKKIKIHKRRGLLGKINWKILKFDIWVINRNRSLAAKKHYKTNRKIAYLDLHSKFYKEMSEQGMIGRIYAITPAIPVTDSLYKTLLEKELIHKKLWLCGDFYVLKEGMSTVTTEEDALKFEKIFKEKEVLNIDKLTGHGLFNRKNKKR